MREIDQRLQEELNSFYCKLATSQEPLPPEFAKVLNDNFWSLLTEVKDMEK